MFEAFDKPYADPVQLPLVSSCWPPLTIVSLYLLFVLKVGGMLMAKREAFQLRGVLKIYNIGQILYNTLMFAWGFQLIFVSRPYNLRCMTVLPLGHELKGTERTLSYLYHLNKLLDLMDTIFFVLRKKQSQITFLHVFHHVFMYVMSFLLIRLYGHGGHVYMICMFNLPVHMVMYGYYYASSESSGLQESLWWKKYLSLAQLVQFLLMFLHSVYTLLQPNCSASSGFIYLVCWSSTFMFFMFTKFYIKTYIQVKLAKVK
ncbi:hypothetical protein KR009_012196 [Drosophila setifemur]|nr:hypothetical protein KR009_012196 [Drosophila setifemur]